MYDPPIERRTHIVRLDELERIALSGDERVEWLPVRAALELSAFGVNVWRALDAGAEVIGPHVETDDQAAGDEEMYFVVAGRARFRVGATEFDVERGSFVGVSDPAVERSAVALEAATTILAVGARAKGHGVAAWEFVVRAGARYRAGDYDGAVRELEPALALHPESATVRYDLACYESLAGHPARALEHLRAAVTRDARFRELAREEPDFEPLRAHPEYDNAIA